MKPLLEENDIANNSVVVYGISLTTQLQEGYVWHVYLNVWGCSHKELLVPFRLQFNTFHFSKINLMPLEDTARYAGLLLAPALAEAFFALLAKQ